MLTLFHAPQSRSTRILLLLEELGADYDLHQVSIMRFDGTGAPDPANPHPDRKVPFLRHDGAAIPESVAIAIYLADLFADAGLAPAMGDADRGPYLAWLGWSETDFGPAMFTSIDGAADPYMQRQRDLAVARLLAAVERGPWLLGDRFSAADIMVGGTVAYVRNQLPESAALDDWLARLTARPAWQRAMAKDGELPADAG